MSKTNIILFMMATVVMTSCKPKPNYCEKPGFPVALKEALVLDMEDWQRNANYAGIIDFDHKVEQVVKDIVVVETKYLGDNKQFMEDTKGTINACRCETKIRFKDHDAYKQQINGPIAYVREKEHPMNNAYLRLEEEMNYLDNDGFVFSIVVVKEGEGPLKVSKSYPYPLATSIDNAGGLLFNYLESYLKNDTND